MGRSGHRGEMVQGRLGRSRWKHPDLTWSLPIGASEGDGVRLRLCSLLAAHRAQRRASCWAWDNATQGVGAQGGCSRGTAGLGALLL